MNNKCICFVRHCRTICNQKNIWSGKTDIELSKDGLDQIPFILNSIKNNEFDLIYSSPKKRALQLSKVISQEKRIPLIIDERITERNFGELEMSPCIEDDKLEMADWIKNSDLGRRVEKIQDMYYKRIYPFITDVSSQNKKVLIVSHSWVGRLLKFHFENKNYGILKNAPKNGEIIKLV